MKKYSSNRAQKGKIAYRTPDRFIYKMALKSVKNKIRTKTLLRPDAAGLRTGKGTGENGVSSIFNKNQKN